MQCDDIPSLKLYIADSYESVATGIHNEGHAYPEDVKIFRNLFSKFDDFENQSIENTDADRIIDFSYSNKSLGYYSGVTVDLNRSDVLEALKSKDPQCLGNETVANCMVTLEFPLEIQTLSQQCLYWDVDHEDWTDKGCKVRNFISVKVLS